MSGYPLKSSLLLLLPPAPCILYGVDGPVDLWQHLTADVSLVEQLGRAWALNSRTASSLAVSFRKVLTCCLTFSHQIFDVLYFLLSSRVALRVVSTGVNQHNSCSAAPDLEPQAEF